MFFQSSACDGFVVVVVVRLVDGEEEEDKLKFLFWEQLKKFEKMIRKLVLGSLHQTPIMGRLQRSSSSSLAIQGFISTPSSSSSGDVGLSSSCFNNGQLEQEPATSRRGNSFQACATMNHHQRVATESERRNNTWWESSCEVVVDTDDHQHHSSLNSRNAVGNNQVVLERNISSRQEFYQVHYYDMNNTNSTSYNNINNHSNNYTHHHHSRKSTNRILNVSCIKTNHHGLIHHTQQFIHRNYGTTVINQPFFLERYFARYEFHTKYLLSSSDCESMSIRELIGENNEFREGLLNCHLGYTDTKGDLELRELIINKHPNWYGDVAGKPPSNRLAASNVVITTGGVEPILVFAMTCLTKDSHIIIQSPRYQALSEITNIAKTKHSFWHAKLVNQKWTFDVQDLEKLIQPKTTAIILNPIHNPTGHMHTLEEYLKIIEIAKSQNILIFSDEVYRGLEYTEQDASIPSLSALYHNAISMNVMSKSYGLAGLRLGWVVSQNQQILENIVKGKDFTTICNPAPSEYLAKIALKQSEQILHNNRQIVTNNLKIAEEFFKSEENSKLFEWIPPKAGPICFIGFKDGREGAFRFCERVVKDCGVMLLPSTVYNRLDDAHVRIGLGRKNFAEGLQVLSKYMTSSCHHCHH